MNSDISGDRQQWFLRGSSFHSLIQPAVQTLVKLIYSEEPAGFWYIHGPNGVGKTYIIIGAINEAIRQQRSGKYTTALELLNAMRSKVRSDDPFAESKFINQVKNTTILAIDEWGRHRDTEYASERLFEVMDYRYQAAHNFHDGFPAKLTLISSNLQFNQLEPWLQSRLRDKQAKILDMSNLPDLRPKN